MKGTKRSRSNASLVEANKTYQPEEAITKLKDGMALKFDASIDLQLKLQADANASDQMVRGTISLPHGTGKAVRVVVITKDDPSAAKDAGAEEVGGDDLVEKIMKGWLDFDVVVATPSMMKDIAKLGRVLGPRGLMPSPKAGTVTDDVASAVTEIKKGRVEFKMDKQSNLHLAFGKLSFESSQLVENLKSLVGAILAAKPKNIKGEFVQSAHLTSTMGPAFKLDLASLSKEGGNE